MASSVSVRTVRSIIGSTATATKVGNLVHVTGHNVEHSRDYRNYLRAELATAGYQSEYVVTLDGTARMEVY